jgi:hypothetical protein
VETLLGEPPPLKHLAQVQWQMAVTGRVWCDLVSYDPRVSLELQVFVRRIRRDEALIAALEGEVAGFLSEIERTLAQLQGVRPVGLCVELAA